MAANGCNWFEMAVNLVEWLNNYVNGGILLKMLKMAENSWKWLEIMGLTGNG